MIDTADLQAFLAKIEGGAVAVDLLKIGENFGENNHQQYANIGKLGSDLLWNKLTDLRDDKWTNLNFFWVRQSIRNSI